MPIRQSKLMARLPARHHHRQVLEVCLPLVLSLSATTVMEFTDRIFLANYSLNAISAALPAGIVNYLFIAFFGGVGGYCSVFIAQYTGRNLPDQIGSVLWQGIYFTLGAGLVIWLIGHFFAVQIFAAAGHPPAVQHQEVIYFTILCQGSVLHVAMVTLATFFTGRGLTRPVMIITFIGVAINIPLDYCLIYGAFGFPEMGIGGAALATVLAWAVNVVCLVHLIFTPEHDTRFGITRRFQLVPELFARLLRFGVPGALQFTLDILAFTLFILLVGRLGTEALAATNIVISINALAFMPSMGVSQGMSVLVGQALGRGDIPLARTHVLSGALLLCLYIFSIDLVFLFAPQLALAPFLASGSSDTAQVALYCRSLLKIVAAYLFFDALYMVLSGALRGAGDTRFMMVAIALSAALCLVLPVYIGIEVLHQGVVGVWLCVLVFVIVLFLLALFRYRQGLWQDMLVIRERPLPREY